MRYLVGRDISLRNEISQKIRSAERRRRRGGAPRGTALDRGWRGAREMPKMDVPPSGLTAMPEALPGGLHAHWWACASALAPSSAETPLLHRPAEVGQKAGVRWSNAVVNFTARRAGSTDICARHRRWIATPSAHHWETWRHRCARGSSKRVRRRHRRLPSGTTLRLS